MQIGSSVGTTAPLVSAVDGRHTGYRERARAVVASMVDDIPAWEADGHLPRELFARLGAAGLFRERWAAGRSDGLGHAIVLAEEISRLGGGPGVAVTLHGEVFLSTLHRLGSHPDHRALLQDALDGVAVGCFASSEAHGGSVIEAPQTEIAREGDGWRLTGEKRYCSNAARASHALVVARCPDAPAGRDSAFVLVDLEAEGVEVAGSFPTAGIRSCDTTCLRFDAHLPAHALLGALGTGLLHANHGLVLERVSVAAQVLAVARRAMGLAIAHAQSRPMGGERLMDKQAIRHRLADMGTELTAAQTFLHAVALAAADGRAVAHEAAALKLHTAKVGLHVVDESLQMLGARGYTEHWPVEGWWRDMRVARIGAGTDEVMREIVAAGLDRPRREYDAWVAELRDADRPVPERVLA